MQQIGHNIFVETRMQGCNYGCVMTEGGIVMIDTPQTPTAALKWREYIRRKGDLCYLINTEHHSDHTAGNFFFQTSVVAHQTTKALIATLPVGVILERIKRIDPEGLSLMQGFYYLEPNITFSDRLTLYVGKHTFELIHCPGHTAGQISVYLPEERVIFTGDNVFHKVQSFFYQAFPDEWIRSLKRIAELDFDIIIPGHGEVCDKSYLKEQISFIEEWVQTVKAAIERGLSKKEAQENISFIDRYPMDIGLESFGPDLMRANVGRLYDLLTGEP